jgi:hypothetical protein
MEAALAAALAFLNDAAASAVAGDAADAARRTLSLGKILHVLPLPGRVAGTLADLAAGDPLPTAAEVAPIVVTAFVQQSNGLTKALIDDASSYAMSPGERLGLTALTATPE